MIAILVLSYFFWQDIKTFVSAQSELFHSIVLQETSKNLNISQESIKPIDNIFSPPIIFSIVSALFFYHSYLLLFYMTKLDTTYSINNIGTHIKKILLFISSILIGYYVNILFSKDILKGDARAIHLATLMVFYIIGYIALINLLISLGDKSFKVNFIKVISVILCFIPYHAFCAYKGGIISKNVICVVENYTDTNINSTVKEFLDFSSLMFKTEDKKSNKSNK